MISLFTRDSVLFLYVLSLLASTLYTAGRNALNQFDNNLVVIFISTHFYNKLAWELGVPSLKSPKNRFQLSAGLNLENGIQSKVEPTIFEPQLKFKPRLKFLKFGLRLLKVTLTLDVYLHLVLNYDCCYFPYRGRSTQHRILNPY